MQKQKFSLRKMLSADSQEWCDALLRNGVAICLSCDGAGTYTVAMVGCMDGWPFKVIEQGPSLEWVWFFAAARVGMNTGNW